MQIRHLICTDNFAGVERYVATTSVELARRGHHVEILGGNETAMRNALGDSLTDTSESGSVSFINAPSTRTALRAHLRLGRPDIVHSHMTAADAIAVAARPIVRAPVVSTLHFAQPRGHDGLTRRIYGFIPRLVTQEIAISQTVAATAGGNPAVIPNGVPAPQHLSTSDSREPIVLVTQRLNSEKRTAHAIEAFAKSRLAEHGWQLHVTGRGDEADQLDRLANTLGVAPRTSFLGLVDNVDEHMSRASVFLATAPCEPFGLAVVEAMAHSLPVVAADGGAHRETVGSATPETLYPTGDTDAAAALLTRIANEPDWAAALGQRSHRRWAEAFAIESHVDTLDALYRRVARHR